YYSESDCTINLQDTRRAPYPERVDNDLDPNTAACDDLPGLQGEQPDVWGTVNDHIDRIACLLAWYVYDHYTAPPGGIPQAVNMLGHSMGGLVIRDAIARSGHDSGFPGPLRVLRAVAVASPMGSVAQPYSTLAPDTAQSNDMKSNSEFMQDMAG